MKLPQRKPRGPTYHPDVIAFIRVRLDLDWTHAEIAARLGTTRDGIRRVLDTRGLRKYRGRHNR